MKLFILVENTAEPDSTVQSPVQTGPEFVFTDMCMYVYGSLTLSILTITQRHGDDGVVSSKCSVGNGRVRDEGWGDRWGEGGLGRFVCGGGVCTVHRLDVIKRRVVPALP